MPSARKCHIPVLYQAGGPTERAGGERLFQSFALVERSHEQKLKQLKKKRLFFFEGDLPQNLAMETGTEVVKAKTDLDYRDALLLAIQQEKQAFQLYIRLAETTAAAAAKALFEELAREESVHKIHLDAEYEKRFGGEDTEN